MTDHRDILDHLNTAVVVVGRAEGTRDENQRHRGQAFRVEYINQSAQSLFGISQQRAVGCALDTLLSDSHASPSALGAVLEMGQAFTKRNVSLLLPDGPVRVDYSATPLPDERVLIELEPVDRLLRINREDQHASLRKTTHEFTRSLAHEIKNPLGGIRGAAQLLERLLAGGEQREYTSVIIAETDRLRNLVDRMLGPNHRPRIAGMNIHEAIEQVVGLLETEFPSRVSFRRDYDPSVPEIEADREQLVQAVMNVLKNAIAALEETPDPTIILQTRIARQFTIGATRHRLVANMNFIDNGPGIPAEIADRIFYPMISGRAEGSGLGLAITQAILGQHGGLVECDSEPGRTVFSFFLPIKHQNTEDAP